MVRIVALFSVATASRITVDKHDFAGSVGGPLEVCCLCFQETGEKTDWAIKSYPDDAAAELQGASFMQCRKDQGDGESDCSAFCKAKGYEMKGCMKGDGMEEWRSIEHWSAKTTSGENSWTCSTDGEDSCGCGVNSLLQTDEFVDIEEEEEPETALVQQHESSKGSDVEVCCLCFKETGETTDWKVVSYQDDATAELNGAGFAACRNAQASGTSHCEDACASAGMDMKGCMKGTGMSEWRSEPHWAAKTTAGTNSWTCSTEGEPSSGCECGGSSLLQSEEHVEEDEVSEEGEESSFCTPRCVTQSNCKLGQDMQIWSRTYKMWCPGQIVGSDGKRSPDTVLKKKTVSCPVKGTKGVTVNYTCSPKGKKPVKLKKMVLWKDPKGDNVGKMIQYNSMFR